MHGEHLTPKVRRTFRSCAFTLNGAVDGPASGAMSMKGPDERKRAAHRAFHQIQCRVGYADFAGELQTTYSRECRR